jgi:hypothetical protein
MKKVSIEDHQFISITKFSPNDRGEVWWTTCRCKHCGIKGRRYSIDEPFIYVTDSFSDNRIENCVRDNFVDKYLGTQIQTCRNIYGHLTIPIYSIHTVITPPPNFLNGENGVWIKEKGSKEPLQILFEECVEYPIQPRIKYPLKRSKKPGQPKIIPPYMRIQHVRTRKPVIRFIRTIKPIKRTRTR